MNLEEARCCLANYQSHPLMYESRFTDELIPDPSAEIASGDGVVWVFRAMFSYEEWDLVFETYAEYQEWTAGRGAT